MDQKVEIPQPHPVMRAYRMHNSDELASLADLIRTNGQRDPITIGIVGDNRWIADGRNRLKACEIVGVEPRFEEQEFENEDALLAFIMDRNERRNITSGQKAMAWAMINREREKPGPGKKRYSGKPEKLSKGHWENLVSQARAVLDYSEPLGDAVVAGRSLSEAFEQAKRERQAAEAETALKERLAKDASDLMAMVQDGKLSIREAIAALDQREQEAEKKRRVATGNLARIVDALYPMGAPPERVDAMKFNEVDQRFWPQEAPPLNKETLQDCINVLASLVRRWPEKGEIK